MERSRVEVLRDVYNRGGCSVHDVPSDGACFYHSVAAFGRVRGRQEGQEGHEPPLDSLDHRSGVIKNIILYHMYKSSMRGQYDRWHRILHPSYPGGVVAYYRPRGVYADEIIVRAAVDALNISLYVISHGRGNPDRDPHIMEFLPDPQRCRRKRFDNPQLVIVSLSGEHYRPVRIRSPADALLFCRSRESEPS
jgi:hypothetical protein